MAQNPAPTPVDFNAPTALGIENGTLNIDTPDFTLKLAKSSQTVTALLPKGAGGFDFTPADRLAKRVTQDRRAWIAGLGDEGGSTWLAAAMKQFGQPDAKLSKADAYTPQARLRIEQSAVISGAAMYLLKTKMGKQNGA